MLREIRSTVTRDIANPMDAAEDDQVSPLPVLGQRRPSRASRPGSAVSIRTAGEMSDLADFMSSSFAIGAPARDSPSPYPPNMNEERSDRNPLFTQRKPRPSPYMSPNSLNPSDSPHNSKRFSDTSGEYHMQLHPTSRSLRHQASTDSMPTLAPSLYSVSTGRYTSAGPTTPVTYPADLPPSNHLGLKDGRRTGVDDTSLLYLRDDEEDNYHDVHNDPFPPLREKEIRGHPIDASSWPQKRPDAYWTLVDPIPPGPTPVSTHPSGGVQRYQPPTEAPPSLSSPSQVSLGSSNASLSPATGFSRFFKKGKAMTEDERREKQLKKEAARAEKEKRRREQAQRDAEDYSSQAMISMAIGGSTF